MDEKRTGAQPSFTITKTEPDKMLVFGWANVAIGEDGQQLTDLQEDVIDPEELEKAAYEHVLKFRSTGERHDPNLRQKGRLVESCVFTQEKQQALGIPPGIVPEGWWVGYKIDDPAAWEKIKKGDYLSFSIEGKGQRTPIEKARQDYDQYPGYNEWLEENLDASREERWAAEEHYRATKRKGLAKIYADLRKFNPYDKKGRVVGKKEFDAAVKASGFVGYRTWDPGRDGVTGKQTTADGFKKQLMHADSIQAAGNGLRAYGGGTYIAATKNPNPGTSPSRASSTAAKSESRKYGLSSTKATAAITLDPSAKVADYDKMRASWQTLSRSDKKRFGNDIGAYAAAQGYDAMRKRFNFNNFDYMTIFNRTKTIILDD